MATEYITYLCGHREKVWMDGNRKARERRARYLGDNYVCSACFEEEREKERQKKAQEKAQEAKEAGLPELKGTERQISWALDLRAEYMKKERYHYPISGCVDKKYFTFDKDIGEEIVEMAFRSIDSAKFWIETKQNSWGCIEKEAIYEYIKLNGVSEIKQGMFDCKEENDKKWYPVCNDVYIDGRRSTWEIYLELSKEELRVTANTDLKRIEDVCEEHNLSYDISEADSLIIKADLTHLEEAAVLIGQYGMNYSGISVVYINIEKLRDFIYQAVIERRAKEKKLKEFRAANPFRIEVDLEKKRFIVYADKYEEDRTKTVKQMCREIKGAYYNWKQSEIPITSYKKVLKLAEEYNYHVTPEMPEAIDKADEIIRKREEYIRDNYTLRRIPCKLISANYSLERAIYSYEEKWHRGNAMVNVLVKNDYDEPKISLNYELCEISRSDVEKWNSCHKLEEQLILYDEYDRDRYIQVFVPDKIGFKVGEIEYKRYAKWNKECEARQMLVLKSYDSRTKIAEVYISDECAIEIDLAKVEQYKNKREKIAEALAKKNGEAVFVPKTIDADSLKVEVPECLQN